MHQLLASFKTTRLKAVILQDFESVSHTGLLAQGDTDGLAAVTEWLEGLLALHLQPPTSGKARSASVRGDVDCSCAECS